MPNYYYLKSTRTSLFVTLGITLDVRDPNTFPCLLSSALRFLSHLETPSASSVSLFAKPSLNLCARSARIFSSVSTNFLTIQLIKIVGGFRIKGINPRTFLAGIQSPSPFPHIIVCSSTTPPTQHCLNVCRCAGPRIVPHRSL